MQTYFVLFTFILLSFYSVVLSAGLEGVLNVAKCIADIHQELRNSVVFITKSMENNKVRRTNVMILKKMYSDFN